MKALQSCPFTRQEWYVTYLTACDLNGSQAADLLCISKRTLHKHCENLKAKLSVSSMCAAVAIAVQNEWVTVDGSLG